MNLFGGGNSYKKGGKKRGKGKKQNQQKESAKIQENPLKEVRMYGFSKIGQGPKKTECQDSYCIMEKFADECYFFAVYDGHGSSGKEASTAANDFIQTYLTKSNIQKSIKNFQNNKDCEKFLKKIFRSTETKLKQSGIDYSNSGTCCISVFIQKNIAYIANLGDSRAVMYRCKVRKEKLAIELSWDHKPTRPEEKERILKKGGRIEKLISENQPVGPYRVWADEEGPGIAMTRTIGDLHAKKIGLISDPEIQYIELQPCDKFIVIGSDGVWDVMSSAEVVGFVDMYCNGKDNWEGVAEALVAECRSRWEEQNRSKKNSSKIGDLPQSKYGIDDITAIVAFFTYKEETDGK